MRQLEVNAPENLLTDDVWAALDPTACRLPRRVARRWPVTTGAGVALSRAGVARYRKPLVPVQD